MTDLERLTQLMSQEGQLGARLGYVLGLLHGLYPDQIPDIDLDGPELRVIEDMGLEVVSRWR
jgi:hypothetical protein